jgi:cysteine synthase
MIKNIFSEIGKRTDIIDFLKSDRHLIKIFDLPNRLSKKRINLYKEVYSGIGNTPCYQILLPNNNKLLLKCEYLNPFGNNHYSRFWAIYIFIGEVLGVLSNDKMRLLEVTSGSNGIALAQIAEILGYSTTIIIPKNLPLNRTSPMMRPNVDLIEVSGYVRECIEKFKEIYKTENFFATNHALEKADIIIHVFTRIGLEHINEYGSPDYAFIGLGNGSSSLGMAKIFKRNPETKLIGYRPQIESENHEKIYGLIVPNIDFRHLEETYPFLDKVEYTDNVSFNMIKKRFRDDTEISELGKSSLAGLYYALHYSESLKNKTFFSVGYDKRYG